MNDAQRDQVRSNAKYLRNVRPLDPEELAEYVEGDPAPSAVRSVLRDLAPELDVVEGPAGTFRPVREGTTTLDVDALGTVPEERLGLLQECLVERFGESWATGESGQRLRTLIREFKDRYLRGDPVEYDEDTALAYALYHFPQTYAATQYLFGELGREGLVPTRLRVLDVGAGVGGPAAGIADAVPADALLEYHAVEPSAAAALLERVLGRTGPNVHWTVDRSTAEAFEAEGPYDVVLFANVLGELADPVGVVETALDALAADGSLVAMAPADRNTATGLRQVERAVADDGPATVYAPTVRLWPGESPTSESWSFDVKPDIAVPALQGQLDRAGPGDGEFVNADVQYAFSVLRRDGRRRFDVQGDRKRVATLATAEAAVTRRVNLLAVKLSHDLSNGDHPLFLVGDGSQSTDHFAVLTEETALNRSLRAAGYGALLSVENVLVLWNDDEGAYNLVVDGDTVVDARAVPGAG